MCVCMYVCLCIYVLWGKVKGHLMYVVKFEMSIKWHWGIINGDVGVYMYDCICVCVCMCVCVYMYCGESKRGF